MKTPCPYKVSDRTREKLLAEMDEDEFFPRAPDRPHPLNKFDDYFHHNRIDLDNEEDRQKLGREFNCYSSDACDIIRELRAFEELEPRWPDAPREKTAGLRLDLPPACRAKKSSVPWKPSGRPTPAADLAFYAARDLARTDPRPFFKAAIERSPAGVEAARAMDPAAAAAVLRDMPGESIYDATRAAQPDEVWNSRRGDGLEKAVTLAAILHARQPEIPFAVRAGGETATLSFDGTDHAFPTRKGLTLDLEWPLRDSPGSR